MMKVRKWFKDMRADEVASAGNPDQIRGTFLDLPGETRNQIYAYVIYPNLSSVTIANCTKSEHLGASLLHPPLFRTCRQIRAETLSYLCATFSLKIFGLPTAITFISCAGRATSEVKSIVLVQPALALLGSPEGQRMVDSFCSALDTMAELEEITLTGLGMIPLLNEDQGHPGFMERIEAMSTRGITVHTKSGER